MPVYRRLIVIAAAAVLGSAAFAAAPKPNIEKGRKAFDAQCGICHSTERAVDKIMAPNLAGVVGRQAAAYGKFTNYSPALKRSKITWNSKTLDEFLQNPTTRVPGTTMPMMIADNQMRADVIAYLATLK